VIIAPELKELVMDEIERVFFLTVVLDGHVSVTSIIATTKANAEAQCYALFNNLGTDGWEVETCLPSGCPDVTTFFRKDQRFRATLIAA
jgi:hypothetical protein